MTKRKLTPVQETLYSKLMGVGSNLKLSYDQWKKLADTKSFDASFNALLVRGWVKRVHPESDHFELVP